MSNNDPREWGLASHLLGSYGILTVLAGVALFTVVMIVTLFLGSVDNSLWEIGMILPRLYAFFVINDAVKTHLPLHLAHGGTRRQYYRQLTVLVLGHSLVLAGVATIGFRAESALAGWLNRTATIDSYTFFSSANELGAIATTFLIVFVVWGAATAMGTIYRYRDPDTGGLVVIGAVVIVLFVEASIGGNFRFFGFLQPLLRLEFWPLGSTAALAAGLSLLAWLIGKLGVRDIPIRGTTET